MKKFNTIILILSVIFIAKARASKLNVVATLPDLGAIAKEIGGERIKLTVLANGNEDPHFVDPKPSFIRVLNQADVLIDNGAELEAGWLPPLVNNARNSKILGYSANHIIGITGVKMLEVPIGKIDRSQGDVHPMGNPHYLLSPDNCLIVASNIMESFSTIDRDGAQFYRNNLDKFTQRLNGKIVEWKKIIATLQKHAGYYIS
jgi:zinc/manganese transport system substrate-binding protein